jgi:hypothetical protein
MFRSHFTENFSNNVLFGNPARTKTKAVYPRIGLEKVIGKNLKEVGTS